MEAVVRDAFAPAVKLPGFLKREIFGNETVPLIVKLPGAPPPQFCVNDVREFSINDFPTGTVISPFMFHVEKLPMKMPFIVNGPLTVELNIPVPTTMVPLFWIVLVEPPFVLVYVSVGELPRGSVVPDAIVIVVEFQLAMERLMITLLKVMPDASMDELARTSPSNAITPPFAFHVGLPDFTKLPVMLPVEVGAVKVPPEMV